MPVPVMAIAAILGAAMAAKKNSDEKRQAAIDRATQSQIAQYSPWTGMKGETVKDPGSNMAAMMGGAVGGLGVGQMVQGGMNNEASQNAQNSLTDAQSNYYNNANRQNIISQNMGQGQGGSAGAMGMPQMQLPMIGPQQQS